MWWSHGVRPRPRIAVRTASIVPTYIELTSYVWLLLSWRYSTLITDMFELSAPFLELDFLIRLGLGRQEFVDYRCMDLNRESDGMQNGRSGAPHLANNYNVQTTAYVRYIYNSSFVCVARAPNGFVSTGARNNCTFAPHYLDIY